MEANQIMPDLAYVTSFNPELYEATGKDCLDSWAEHVGGELYAYHEDFPDDFEGLPHVTHYIDVMELPFLQKWLDMNSDIIPTKLGGKFVCKCPGAGKQRFNKGHKKNCPGGGFRGRASQWFRKFASLYHCVAINQRRVKAIVWVDTDIVFKQRLPDKVVLDKLGDSAMLYHMGPTRRQANVGAETGFWVINVEGGIEILDDMYRRFMDGRFRKYHRWDEAWMLWEVLKDRKYNARDVVTKRTPTGHVVEAGEFAKYITHNKGIHWRKGNRMRARPHIHIVGKSKEWYRVAVAYLNVCVKTPLRTTFTEQVNPKADINFCLTFKYFNPTQPTSLLFRKVFLRCR